jgi:hypothetical protein
MITLIILHATAPQLIAARRWTEDNLHVPESAVTTAVAVAYVVKHFKAGQLEGWDGFITDMEV